MSKSSADLPKTFRTLQLCYVAVDGGFAYMQFRSSLSDTQTPLVDPSVMDSRFVIVGPPAMGKSTLLRFIPSIIQHATAIDLENTAFPRDRPSLKQLAKELIGIGWRGPLFLGNAGADSMNLALLGYQVIGLHHADHDRYLRRMSERDSERGTSSQGDHWEHHRELFLERMPDHNIEPFVLDTIAENLDGDPSLAIRHIATHFSLPLWTDHGRDGH